MNGDTAMTTVTGPVTGPPKAPDRLRMTPGRWAALAIGVPVALVLILGGGLSLVSDIGMASFPVSRAIPLGHGRLVADLNGADLTVRTGGASGGAARLTGTVQYSLVRPDFSVSESTGIDLHCRILLGNCGLNAELSVPPATALDLSSGGGNVQVSGIQSTVTLTTGGGNLSVSDLGGVLKFITSGGDVDGSSLTSPKVTMDTGGGNVSLTFTSPPANLRVTSSGGDITIVVPRGTTEYAIKKSTAGGGYGASVPTNDLAAHKITVDSGGGNVTITEPR
jgi:hypothetical protein